MKRKDPFKPMTPQGADYFINMVKYPIMKKKLKGNMNLVKQQLSEKYYDNRTYEDMYEFVAYGIFNISSHEKSAFWDAVAIHFKSGSGKKSYKDFKHLDKSI